MKKTKFGSYYINGIAKGCKHCVRGRKLVLFISGICSRNCSYCSLSNLRKNIDKTWANERKCRTIKDIFKESIESKADSAGITGGDPLIRMRRTLKYANGLKKKFGEKFHIHIYLPTKLVNRENLKKISRSVDEIRFHPEFLLNKNSEKEDIKKIIIAKEFFKKENIGIELPILPNKKKEIMDFIIKIKKDIGFANLNELEIGENNMEFIIKNYKLKENGYVISKSKEAGIWILKELEKKKIRLKVHLCTAETKNSYQYKNRIKLHKILPFGRRTKDGTVVYLVLNKKNLHEKVSKESYIDKSKNRLIISQKLAKKIMDRYRIERVEEFPTYDRIEVEKEYIN